MGKLFGTDGIRGVVGENLTADLAFRVGQAIAAVLSPGVPPRGIPSVPMPRIGSTSSLSAVH